MSDFHVMTTKSGRTFTPLNDYDLLEVVYEEMGQDVHDYLAEILLETDVEKNIAEKKFNSDYLAMEQEVEGWHNFVDDISEELEKLREKVENNELTKANISLEMYKLYEKMRKEL